MANTCLHLPAYRPRAVPTDLGNVARRDVLEALLGDMLGRGASREVYTVAWDETKVIKIEDRAGAFQNALEWAVWNRAVGTDLEQWLAPCYWIAPAGAALIQARTKPLKTFPDKLPSIFLDTKKQNWGLWKGRPVCHDYGVLQLVPRSKLKMRSAEFWTGAPN